jgi:hypothetical protein
MQLESITIKLLATMVLGCLEWISRQVDQYNFKDVSLLGKAIVALCDQSQQLNQATAGSVALAAMLDQLVGAMM